MFGLSWKLNGSSNKRFFMTQESMNRYISWLKYQVGITSIIILANSLNETEKKII